MADKSPSATVPDRIVTADANLAQLAGNQPTETTKAGSAYALAQATIALAEAQHTANRIAWLAYLKETGGGGRESQELIKQIRQDLS